MNPREFCRLAGRLMRHPVAPYYEHAVSGEVQQICGENRLHCEKDPFGNLLVRTWERRRLAGLLRPIVFAAHMDHPGFEIVRPDSSGHLRVRFQGGVPDQYFRRGLAVQLMPGNDRAKLGRRVGKERIFELQSLESSSTNAAFAVWDLE